MINILGMKVREEILIKMVRGVRYTLEGMTILSILLIVGAAFY